MCERPIKKPNWMEALLGQCLFRSRWLLMPFYIGLMFGLLALIFHFILAIPYLFSDALNLNSSDIILDVLYLIDLSLVANLLILVMFSGYENFVSHINTVVDNRPDWMGKIDFSGMKIKLMASIAAISAISLLESLLKMSSHEDQSILFWKIGIHMTFIISGVLFALMDWLEIKAHNSKDP